MSIVKRKDKNDKPYFLNTTTGKRASEAAYKKSKSASISKFKARKGKPSEATCSSYGAELKVKRTSAAGRGLRKCR
jgi:Lhr-like helicase